MKRGDVHWVDFDPSTGSEVQKIRPAVIVSNDGSNRCLSRLQVVPLTSRVEKIFPSECPINCQGKKSKAMADQLMTVDKGKVRERICAVTPAEMEAVEHAIVVQLGLLKWH